MVMAGMAHLLDRHANKLSMVKMPRLSFLYSLLPLRDFAEYGFDYEAVSHHDLNFCTRQRLSLLTTIVIRLCPFPRLDDTVHVLYIALRAASPLRSGLYQQTVCVVVFFFATLRFWVRHCTYILPTESANFVFKH